MAEIACIRCEGTGEYFALAYPVGGGEDPVWVLIPCDCPPIAEVTAPTERNHPASGSAPSATM